MAGNFGCLNSPVDFFCWRFRLAAASADDEDEEDERALFAFVFRRGGLPRREDLDLLLSAADELAELLGDPDETEGGDGPAAAGGGGCGTGYPYGYG